ncbi:MAG: putative DNA-binding domain-containing protein [Labilithrix sp.]
MTTARVQQLIARACFGKDPPSDEELAAAHLPPKRVAIYRRLLRHNVTGVIETMLAKTKERLEARAPGEWERAIDAFLDEVGPRTPHLRDVPSEFLAFIAPRWRSVPEAGVPRWLADHAELELLDFTISVAPRPLPPPPLADVTAERALVFAEPKALIRLAWAVNAMKDEVATAEPEERPVAILVYRDAEHCSRFLELTPLAAAIVERLFAGEPLGRALTSACAVLDQDVLDGTARLLADLGERGVLIGARDA